MRSSHRASDCNSAQTLLKIQHVRSPVWGRGMCCVLRCCSDTCRGSAERWLLGNKRKPVSQSGTQSSSTPALCPAVPHAQPHREPSARGRHRAGPEPHCRNYSLLCYSCLCPHSFPSQGYTALDGLVFYKLACWRGGGFFELTSTFHT